MQRAKRVFGERFFYQLYFQRIGEPETELAQNVKQTVLKIAWSLSAEGAADLLQTQLAGEGGFLARLSAPKHPLEWLTAEDLDYFVTEYQRTGYSGALNWYRNIDRNWALTPGLANAKVTTPVLFIAGRKDPLLWLTSRQQMESWANLRRVLLIENAGHWVHMEQPDTVNDAIVAFLREQQH
jgi:pimeloyl-ACP methyl ester carboxylesterase